MGRSGLFYGWVVVGCAFVAMFIGFGAMYSFAAFFDSLQAEFHATRGEVSGVFSLAGFLYFCVGPLSGPLADRHGPRRVVSAGVVLLAAGLVLAALGQALWQVYAAFGLLAGLGVGFVYVPSIGTVQRWFVRRRGLASGLAVAGIGMGTLVMPPVAGRLIEALAWRGTYLVMGAGALVLGLAAAGLLAHSPERMGLRPDGDTAPPDTGEPDAPATGGGTGGESDAAAWVTMRRAVGSAPFWLLYVATLLGGFGLFIPFVHLAAYAQDHGLSEQTGLLLVGLIGVGSVSGRFLMGGVADRMGRRLALMTMYGGIAAMLLWWLAAERAWSLGVFAVLFGVFYGGFVAVIPALIADYFGGPHLIGIIGLMYTSVGFGTLLGPTLAGFAYDLSRSYTLPIVASAFALAVAVGLMLLLAEPARWRAAAAPDHPGHRS